MQFQSDAGKTAQCPIRIIIRGTADRSFLYVLSFSLRMEVVGKDQKGDNEISSTFCSVCCGTVTVEGVI